MISFNSVKQGETFFDEYIINKSRFLCYIKHIDTQQQAEDFLVEINEKHKDATHCCYAYVLTNTSKASDDGEPSGTAGMPILQVLKKKNLVNLIAIVVRYFGGIKLGAGGLVRAYTNSVVECLNKVNICKYQEAFLYTKLLNYKEYETFIRFLLQKGAVISKTEFLQEVKITFVAPIDIEFVDAQKENKILFSFD